MFAPPSPPCVFYGYVTIGEDLATDGLNVTAAIVGTGLKWTTQTGSGTYGWPVKGSSLLSIPSNDPDTSQKDGGVTGDTVEFYVNGTKTDRTAIFESSSAKRFDLSIPGPVLEHSTLSAALECPTTYVGYKVKISGRLAHPNGEGISGASLEATYSTGGGQSWSNIASFNTTANGDYYVDWNAPTTGNYLVKISWEGNENVRRADAYLNLAVTPLEEKYVFSVISNSTISDLTFNSTSKILSFTLDGPTGTTGFVDATIAKNVVADITRLRIYLDDNQTDFATTTSSASWILHFTYQHSTHEVAVNLGSSTQIFLWTPLGTATLFIVIAVLIAIIYVGRNKLRRHGRKKIAGRDLKSRK